MEPILLHTSAVTLFRLLRRPRRNLRWWTEVTNRKNLNKSELIKLDSSARNIIAQGEIQRHLESQAHTKDTASRNSQVSNRNFEFQLLIQPSKSQTFNSNYSSIMRRPNHIQDGQSKAKPKCPMQNVYSAYACLQL